MYSTTLINEYSIEENEAEKQPKQLILWHRTGAGDGESQVQTRWSAGGDQEQTGPPSEALSQVKKQPGV